MRRTILLALTLAGAGCATLTPAGKSVKVYQADVASADQPAPPLPEGCKRLKEWGPIDQQQEAREISDPYLQERNTTAAAGGNVLYLRSFRFKNLMKIDCPVGNTSPGCMDSEQSWYKVTFESYACDAGALAELATVPPPTVGSIFKWELKKKTAAATVAPPPAAPAAPAASVAPPSAPVAAAPAPRPAAVAGGISVSALKAKILDLQHEGVGADVIVSYVRANRPPAALTADEIIDWKKSGIPDEVIRATFPN